MHSDNDSRWVSGLICCIKICEISLEYSLLFSNVIYLYIQNMKNETCSVLSDVRFLPVSKGGEGENSMEFLLEIAWSECLLKWSYFLLKSFFSSMIPGGYGLVCHSKIGTLVQWPLKDQQHYFAHMLSWVRTHIWSEFWLPEILAGIYSVDLYGTTGLLFYFAKKQGKITSGLCFKKSDIPGGFRCAFCIKTIALIWRSCTDLFWMACYARMAAVVVV